MWACMAALTFMISSGTKAQMSADVGYESAFYKAIGVVVASLGYFLYKCVQTYKKERRFWNDQNIIVDGKFKCINLLGFVVYSLAHFGILIFVVGSVYFAVEAGVNTGVIISIWSITPFFAALADYVMFRQTLKPNQVIGITMFVICIVLLSLKDVIEGKVEEQVLKQEGEKVYPAWMAVVAAALTPVFFALSMLAGKYITQPRIGFNATNVAFSAVFVFNFVILIVALFVWRTEGFSKFSAIVGLIGGISEALGKMCIQNAVSKGPSGPAAAISNQQAMLLVIVDAIMNKKMVSSTEIVSFIFSFLGSLIMVVPELFVKLFCLGRKKVASRAGEEDSTALVEKSG